MKSNLMIYIFAITFLMLSCDNVKPTNLAPEYLYDAKNQKVIKSIINNRKGKIAILYGNDLALQTAGDSLLEMQVGANYTLVTWNQKQMPQWYGANMNGEIYSVETVNVVQANRGDIAFQYDFSSGNGFRPGDHRPSEDQRIRFITEQRTAIFP